MQPWWIPVLTSNSFDILDYKLYVAQRKTIIIVSPECPEWMSIPGLLPPRPELPPSNPKGGNVVDTWWTRTKTNLFFIHYDFETFLGAF